MTTTSIVQSLNLNQLRVFVEVYRAGNMTQAARQLHLTQPGVSQHIKALEETLGVQLFDRVQKKLVPTRQAQVLFEQCQRAMIALEEALIDVTGRSRELRGTVSIGMPVEFGNNILLPLLSAELQKIPDLRLSIRYGLAREMSQLLMRGEIDFAFVDAFRLEKGIETEPVYREALHLCVRSEVLTKHKNLRKEVSKETLQALTYVDYEAGAAVLKMWFRHHLGRTTPEFRLQAHGLDVQGVSRWILSGNAAGVLPGHHLETLRKKGHSLEILDITGSEPLQNQISLAYLSGRTFTAGASYLLQAIREKL